MKSVTSWWLHKCNYGVILAAIVSFHLNAQSACDDMMREADAVSGAIPKFENGQLVSVSIYADAAFINAKPSLIGNARTQAEMQAKSFLSAFFEEQIHTGTLYQALVKNTELTSGEGITESQALEIRQTVNYITSSSSAVLRGIVKLDECVDTEQKFILVRMGWKPSQALQSNQHQPQEVQAQTQPSASPNVGGIQYTELETIGTGANYDDAIRSGLRSAVAQVFGEAFASSSEVTNQVDTLEISDSKGNEAALAIESRNTNESSTSKTSGVIHQYRILQVEETSQGYEATLKVVLARYQSGLDKSKQNIVVLPTLSSSAHQNIAILIQQRLEQSLSNSKKFNLLDREFINLANNELGYIASGNSPIEELSRLGNQVGADLLIITEITNYSVNITERQVGDRNITRSELSANVRIKAINPATSEIVISDIVSLVGHRVAKPSLNSYADIITHQLSSKIITSPVKEGADKNKADVTKTKNRISEKQKKMEKEYEDEW